MTTKTERSIASRDALYNAGQYEVARLSWEETYGPSDETTQVIPHETMSEVVSRRLPFAGAVLGAFLLLSGVANAAGKPTDVQHSKSGQDGLIKVAECRDGKSYYAPTNEHRGACSGHGGVASWADGSPVKAGGKSARYR